MAFEIGIFRRGFPLLNLVPVDLRLSEVHTAEAIPTTQPIEDGTELTDHIILQPDTVTIQAEIGNYDFITRGLTSGERAKAAWYLFKRQLRIRNLYTIITAHEIYTDMCLSGLNGENSAPFQGRMIYTLTFIKLNLTQTSLVTVPEQQLEATVEKSASSTVNAGQVDPPSNTSSLALRAAQALGILE